MYIFKNNHTSKINLQIKTATDDKSLSLSNILPSAEIKLNINTNFIFLLIEYENKNLWKGIVPYITNEKIVFDGIDVLVGDKRYVNLLIPSTNGREMKENNSPFFTNLPKGSTDVIDELSRKNIKKYSESENESENKENRICKKILRRTIVYCSIIISFIFLVIYVMIEKKIKIGGFYRVMIGVIVLMLVVILFYSFYELKR